MKFAVNVMGVEAGEEQATIEAGIQAMEAFYRETGMPTNLKELGVPYIVCKASDEKVLTRCLVKKPYVFSYFC